jgi:hypothetical protein
LNRRPRPRCRIGDPAVFFGVYDAAGQEEEISKAFESSTVDALERGMEDQCRALPEAGGRAAPGQQLIKPFATPCIALGQIALTPNPNP